MTTVAMKKSSLTAEKFRLTGLVQGIGMRPAIARLACELELNGFVCNNASGVAVHVEGNATSIENFADQLRRSLPRGSDVASIHRDVAEPGQMNGFTIRSSNSNDLMSTAVPPDRAICDLCREDVAGTKNRRSRYAFTTCTKCGPRYSLTHSMPFDRAGTAMERFALCPECNAEYQTHNDRRFHAQTTACHRCGPALKFHGPPLTEVRSDFEAIVAAAEAIRQGLIVAVKGVGGYQLICDATSTDVVQRLRKRKRRQSKPLAVMVPSLEEAQSIAIVDEVATEALLSAENPIVLLPSNPVPLPTQALRTLNQTISPANAPGLHQIGLMLPTSPLHQLLLEAVDVPCVVTSGNVDGDPLVFENERAAEALQGLADAWLHHDRDIVRPVDDSVVRIIAKHPVTIRAARGIAPLPIDVQTDERILAVGGQQKVALALSNGSQTVLGPHIGDMNSISTRQRFVDQVEQLTDLYKTEPKVIAHDLHPDFFTTRWAQQHCQRTVAVQHHHAHIVAGMIEHLWLDQEVLGVAFDGTGYGTDRTIWGGEFLLCTSRSFQRVARLRTWPLIGGERAIKEPWRVAVALLRESGIAESHHLLNEAWPEPNASYRLETLRCRSEKMRAPDAHHWESDPERVQYGSSPGQLFPFTSSMGRLFDGIASLLLDIREVSFEGEAAMRLEAVCDTGVSGEYSLPIDFADLAEIDWRPMIRHIVEDMDRDVPVGTIAMRFTRSIASVTAAIRERFPDHPIVLSGGCFQNAVLTEATAVALSANGHRVGFPGRIPPNDGGLAAGQLAVAAAQSGTPSDSKGAC